MNEATGVSKPTKPTIKSIAAHSWWVFAARPAAFLTLAFLSHLPTVIYFTFLHYFSPEPNLLAIGTACFVVAGIAAQYLAAILILAAHNTIEGQEDAIGAMLGPVLSRWAPLLLVFIVMGICIPLVTSLGSMFIISLYGSKVVLLTFYSTLSQAFMAAIFAVSIPLCLIGGQSAKDSLTGGVALMKGYLFKICLLIAAINLVASYSHHFITIYLPGLLAPNIHLAALPVAIFILAFKYVMYATIYYDLKDWRDSSSLVEVFH